MKFEVGDQVEARAYVVRRYPELAGLVGEVTAVGDRGLGVTWPGIPGERSLFASNLRPAGQRPTRRDQTDEPARPRGRTDVHRPAALVTEDYDFLGAYDSQGIGVAAIWRAELIDHVIVQPRRCWAGIHPSGQCDHCGAHIRYVALMLHRPTDRVLQVGEVCLENRFERATEEFHRLRRQAELDRRAQRIKKGVAEFVEAHPELAFLADPEETQRTHPYLVGLSRILRTYGSLFDWRIDQAHELMERERRDAEREATRAAEEALLVPVPEELVGRVALHGEVVGLKRVEGDYGTVLKAMLKVPTDDAGHHFKVWTTVPAAALDEVAADDLRGAHVHWAGTLRRSSDDPTFGIMRRPRVVTMG